MQDIFQFWSVMKPVQKIHPADGVVFKRIDPERHSFRLNCLPGCFAGALRSPSIVFLYLSPGYSKADAEDAAYAIAASVMAANKHAGERFEELYQRTIDRGGHALPLTRIA